MRYYHDTRINCTNIIDTNPIENRTTTLRMIIFFISIKFLFCLSLYYINKYLKVNRKNAVVYKFIYLKLLVNILYINMVFYIKKNFMKISSKILFFSLVLSYIFLWNISLASDWNLPWVTIISRPEWWADESLRFRSTPRPTKSSTWTKSEAQIKAENISKIRNAWMAKNFPIEWKYEWSNTMFWNKW